MYEEDVASPVETRPHSGGSGDHSPILKYLLLAVALIYVIASLYFMYTLKGRLDAQEAKQQSLESAQTDLAARLHSTKSEFKEALTSEVGLTKAEIARRSAELERAQKAAAAKLQAEQSQQGQQIAAVNTAVTGVKSEVGAAKTDIAKTQTDLQATNQKLERTIGDLGVQSGLIAHTSSELDILKHKGDKNYYEFTLQKGKKQPISTVSLELKKVDAKKSRFTMNVSADDKTIEKKDRTVGEPLQFYTGRDHLLYEIVVFSADKNSITGYLSTPKNAPKPVTP
jgi:multidrug efflux pump subunit AcrA (membrane-fusion protein)